jgi:hypothetical protein
MAIQPNTTSMACQKTRFQQGVTACLNLVDAQ